MSKEDPKTLHLISHPMRWKILNALTNGPMQMIQIGDYLGIKPQLVNHHLRRLEEAGLVKTAYMKAERGGDVLVYRLVPRKWSLTIDAKTVKLRGARLSKGERPRTH